MHPFVPRSCTLVLTACVNAFYAAGELSGGHLRLLQLSAAAVSAYASRPAMQAILTACVAHCAPGEALRPPARAYGLGQRRSSNAGEQHALHSLLATCTHRHIATV